MQCLWFIFPALLFSLLVWGIYQREVWIEDAHSDNFDWYQTIYDPWDIAEFFTFLDLKSVQQSMLWSLMFACSILLCLVKPQSSCFVFIDCLSWLSWNVMGYMYLWTCWESAAAIDETFHSKLHCTAPGCTAHLLWNRLPPRKPFPGWWIDVDQECLLSMDMYGCTQDRILQVMMCMYYSWSFLF